MCNLRKESWSFFLSAMLTAVWHTLLFTYDRCSFNLGLAWAHFTGPVMNLNALAGSQVGWAITPFPLCSSRGGAGQKTAFAPPWRTVLTACHIFNRLPCSSNEYCWTATKQWAAVHLQQWYMWMRWVGKKHPTAFHCSTTIKSGVGEVPEDAAFNVVLIIYSIVVPMCSQ